MIHEPNDKFDFSKLALCKPISNSNGSFFIKYAIGEQPLYIQTPKCTVKQMVTKTAGKKMYCDLIFQQENDSFIRWMENLETRSQTLLYDHRQEWFKTDLERDDIEQSFSSPMKVVKSGKQYIVRANLQSTLRIYDENEQAVVLDAIVENTKVMVILEIQGVRSGSNFQVDIEIKQMLVLKPEEVFSGLRIRYEKEKEKEKENPLVNPPSTIELSSLSAPAPAPAPEPPSENIFIDTTPIEEISEEVSEELCEVNIEPTDEIVQLKERKEMYYKMYQEARQKAKIARDLALSSYLEAKQIKNKYMLDDILDSSSDESDEDDSDTEKTD